MNTASIKLLRAGKVLMEGVLHGDFTPEDAYNLETSINTNLGLRAHIEVLPENGGNLDDSTSSIKNSVK